MELFRRTARERGQNFSQRRASVDALPPAALASQKKAARGFGRRAAPRVRKQRGIDTKSANTISPWRAPFAPTRGVDEIANEKSTRLEVLFSRVSSNCISINFVRSYNPVRFFTSADLIKLNNSREPFFGRENREISTALSLRRNRSGRQLTLLISNKAFAD